MQIKKRIKLLLRKTNFLQVTKEVLYIVLGIFSACFGLKSFLLPNHFLDGGAMGISLILQVKTGLPLALLIVSVNIPFVLLGLKQISKMFAFKTIVAIIGLALLLSFEIFPIITSDKLLISIFGGFFLGAGIGLAMRGGAVLDGSEVLALYISRKTSLSVGDIIMGFNIFIFSFAAFVFGIETAMYAILTYLSAAKTVDFIIHGIEEYIGVTIISGKNDVIRQAITKRLKRAVTIYKGEKGYSKNIAHLESEIDILFTVVTKMEVTKLRNMIHSIDKQAFIVTHTVNETYGGMIKARPLDE
ncbi:MAG: YitT family protein [Sphingobacteriales bacterium]|nr:MAG: YitT family protein [Sphingobacteriales bacterium]